MWFGCELCLVWEKVFVVYASALMTKTYAWMLRSTVIFLLHCCTHCCSQEIVSNGSGVASMLCRVAMATKQAGSFVWK